MYYELLPTINHQKEEDLFLFYSNCYEIDSAKAQKKSKQVIDNRLKDFLLYKASRINSRKKYLLNSIINKKKSINEAKERNVSLEELAYIQARWLFNNIM